MQAVEWGHMRESELRASGLEVGINDAKHADRPRHLRILVCLLMAVAMASTALSGELDRRMKLYAESQRETLALFPVYFTPLGKPRLIEVELGGKKYWAGWDGDELMVGEGAARYYGIEPPDEGPPIDYRFDWFVFGCGLGCLVVVLAIICASGIILRDILQ